MEPNDNIASTPSAASPPPNKTPIEVKPCASEGLLRLLLVVVGILLWVVIVVSLIGIVYGILIGAIVLFAQITFIASIRGNSVKLGPQQIPKLYNRVVLLSQRIGLKKVPDVYLMQSGGILNAFATRLGSRNFIVLYSEMVKACGSNMDALDFIIGHELGHLHRGHLRWRWLKAPAHIIPFLGAAYSRACEYTCDQYGRYSCTDPAKVSDSLCVLACGATFAPVINRKEFVTQSKDLNTSFMKLGSWTMSHPPLAKRVAAIDPGLKPAKAESEMMATLGAILLIIVLVAVPVAAGGWFLSSAIKDTADTFAKLKGHHPARSLEHDDDSLRIPAPNEISPAENHGVNRSLRDFAPPDKK